MINALNPTLAVRIFAVLVMALLGASFWIQIAISSAGGPAETWTLVWKSGRLALLLLSLAVLLMTWSRALKVIHAATFGHKWWFPWLGGEWRGEARSNWPRVEAMMRAARGERGKFDTLSDEIDPLTVKIKAQITCELFSIRMRLTAEKTERTSDTIFVRPERKRDPGPTIYYIYKQQDLGVPAVTDLRAHLGAAVLHLNDAGELVGTYWTARNEERGLTTAGTIVLRRVKSPTRKKANKPKAKFAPPDA